MGQDPNDILRNDGAAALRREFDTGARVVRLPQCNDLPALKIGSDQDIAAQVRILLESIHGEMVADGGVLYAWNQQVWGEIGQSDVYAVIKRFDGAALPEGRGRTVRLSKPKLQSIEHLLYRLCEVPGYFDMPSKGIPCQNGFIVIDGGKAALKPHNPDHRNRYVLACDWNGELLTEPPEVSELHRLITGCFRGDPEADLKKALLQEIAGGALIGVTRSLSSPKAIILLGERAGNGKSQLIDMFRGLVPSHAIAALSPAQFSDERLVVALFGKVLNMADEIGDRAISSERFKAVVTGEPITGRAVFKDGLTFRSQALHVFSANRLPAFRDGMDRGVRRRLIVLRCDRVIPEADRVPGIGRIVADFELHLLLAWAVQGALSLLRRGHFDEPPSSRDALNDWARISDSMMEWLGDDDGLTVSGNTSDRVRIEAVYECYRSWCVSMRIKDTGILDRPKFVRRIKAGEFDGLSFIRKANSKEVAGLRINHSRVATVSGK